MSQMRIIEQDPTKPRYAPRVTDWVNLKPIIEKLFDEGLEHEEILAVLKEEHGATLTKYQLTKKLGDWDLRRYKQAQSASAIPTADQVPLFGSVAAPVPDGSEPSKEHETYEGTLSVENGIDQQSPEQVLKVMVQAMDHADAAASVVLPHQYRIALDEYQSSLDLLQWLRPLILDDQTKVLVQHMISKFEMQRQTILEQHSGFNFIPPGCSLITQIVKTWVLENPEHPDQAKYQPQSAFCNMWEKWTEMGLLVTTGKLSHLAAAADLSVPVRWSLFSFDLNFVVFLHYSQRSESTINSHRMAQSIIDCARTCVTPSQRLCTLYHLQRLVEPGSKISLPVSSLVLLSLHAGDVLEKEEDPSFELYYGRALALVHEHDLNFHDLPRHIQMRELAYIKLTVQRLFEKSFRTNRHISAVSVGLHWRYRNSLFDLFKEYLIPRACLLIGEGSLANDEAKTLAHLGTPQDREHSITFIHCCLLRQWIIRDWPLHFYTADTPSHSNSAFEGLQVVAVLHYDTAFPLVSGKVTFKSFSSQCREAAKNIAHSIELREPTSFFADLYERPIAAPTWFGQYDTAIGVSSMCSQTLQQLIRQGKLNNYLDAEPALLEHLPSPVPVPPVTSDTISLLSTSSATSSLRIFLEAAKRANRKSSWSISSKITSSSHAMSIDSHESWSFHAVSGMPTADNGEVIDVERRMALD